jgi:hypothetical protein
LQDSVKIGRLSSGKPIDAQLLFWFCRDRHEINNLENATLFFCLFSVSSPSESSNRFPRVKTFFRRIPSLLNAWGLSATRLLVVQLYHGLLILS